MATKAGRSVFLGTFIHSKGLEKLEYLHDTAVCVDEKGNIVAIEPACDQSKVEGLLLPNLGWTKSDVTLKVAKPGQFFFPGFIGKFASLQLNHFTNDTQIRTSMHPNTPTQASSGNPPSWTG
jgi:hypothetical protein